MTGRGRTLTILERQDTFVFRGYKARELAMQAGLRLVFNGVAGGFVGDLWRLPDLLAYLERRRVAVTVTSTNPAAGETPVSDDTPAGSDLAGAPRDLDLFGGEVA